MNDRYAQPTFARDPVWANPDRTKINCIVRTSECTAERPYVADFRDVEGPGMQLFDRCVSGEFGPVGAYGSANPALPAELSYILHHMMIAMGDKVGPQFSMPDDLMRADRAFGSFMRDVVVESLRGSIRGMAITWGAIAVQLLAILLQCEMSRRAQAAQFARAAGHKVPRRFGELIEKVMDTGIITSAHADHLHALRRIRNACAHDVRLGYVNPPFGALRPDFDLLRAFYVPWGKPRGEDAAMRGCLGIASVQICLRLALKVDWKTVAPGSCVAPSAPAPMSDSTPAPPPE